PRRSSELASGDAFTDGARPADGEVVGGVLRAVLDLVLGEAEVGVLERGADRGELVQRDARPRGEVADLLGGAAGDLDEARLGGAQGRSEEHTSELQSRENL